MGDLLIRIASSEVVRDKIAAALVEDFQSDYEELLDKAQRGLQSIKAGGVELSFDLTSVEHGDITPTVEGTGAARIKLPVR